MQGILAAFFTWSNTLKLRVLSIIQSALIVYLIVAVFGSVAQGQSRNTENTLKLDNNASRVKATIDEVAWLVGSWNGSAFGGTFEEAWQPESAGTMVGIFKLMHSDKPTMYEFQIIVEDEGSLSIRLKHFNPDLSGWEEKDKYTSFPLVKITSNGAFFDGLTYRRDGPDKLKVYVAIESGGEVIEEELLYYRVKDSF